MSSSSASRPRRSPLSIRVWRCELPVLAILCGLVLMAPITTPLEVAGRCRASGDMGLAVFLVVSKAPAALDALDPVELGRLAQPQGRQDLHRSVAGPAAKVTQVGAVIEEPVQKGVGGDLFGPLRRYGADSGDLAHLALSDVMESEGHRVRRRRTRGPLVCV